MVKAPQAKKSLYYVREPPGAQLIAYYLREPSRETKKHPSVIILAVHESGPRVGSTRQEKKFSASNENVMIYDFCRRFSETEEKNRASKVLVMIYDFYRSKPSPGRPPAGRPTGRHTRRPARRRPATSRDVPLHETGEKFQHKQRFGDDL